jgi:hypothetical protein
MEISVANMPVKMHMNHGVAICVTCTSSRPNSANSYNSKREGECQREARRKVERSEGTRSQERDRVRGRETSTRETKSGAAFCPS